MLFDSLLKKKNNLRWQEVAREPNEKLAKIIKSYWNASGMKAEVRKRQDGRWSVFVVRKVTE